MRKPLPLAFLSLVAVAFSGCAAGDDAGPQQASLGEDDVLCIEGIVVDEELVPVAEATIVIEGVEEPLLSDGSGRFAHCPVEPGDYGITVEKKGYAGATQTASVGSASARLTVTLRAVALDVPYHNGQHHTTFVICASFNPVGGVPCTKLVDYVAGTNISSSERFAFPFKIPNPNLVDMLIEMTWTPQSLGKDMLFYIQTPPGQPATALSTKYFSKSGGSPLKGWVTAGIKNRCGANECAGLFDAEPNKVTYEGTTVWSGGNSTIPGVPGYLSGTSLYINHRTEVWMTMFYNRAGSREYTALPDK